MLETLEKPNIKNLVLEETRSRPESPLEERIGLTETHFQEWNKQKWLGETYLPSILTVMFPEHAHELRFSDLDYHDRLTEIHDDVSQSVQNSPITDFGSTFDVFESCWSTPSRVAELKILYPQLDLSNNHPHGEYLQSILDELSDENGLSSYNFGKESQVKSSLKIIDPERYQFKTPTNNQEVFDKEINKFMSSTDMELYTADLGILASQRIFDPHLEYRPTPLIWEMLKKYVKDTQDYNYWHSAAVLAADRISYENGLTLIFDHQPSLDNPIPPYPEIDRTGK